MRARILLSLVLIGIAAAAAATQAPAKKRLLFLTHAGLYKHTSLGPAEKAVTELGQAGGFEVTTVEGYKQDADKIDLTFLTPEYLERFDGIMLMTNGNLPLAPAQRKSLLQFVADGHAFIGAHCAALTFYDDPAFGEMLGGYYRRSIRQNAIAVLKVEEPNHPATRMLGGSWPLVDEFYLFGTCAVGCQPPQRQHRRPVRQSHSDGFLARPRARPAQSRHREDQHHGVSRRRSWRRLSASVVA